MIELKTPRGLPVRVPETLGEGTSARFKPHELAAIERYYREHGYAVVAGVVEQETCEELRRLWDRQVKPADRFIYRQATAKAERHAFNANGWVMNPILNLQSVDPRHFGEFRKFATEQVLTSAELSQIFTTILNDRPKIVQSMYFEGNSATWEHQDTYYLDSENLGSMIGAWIALEPIEAQAGRFFVCPRSHKLDMGLHALHNNIADNHESYITSVVEEVRRQGYEVRAPRLETGDVLLWNSRTIHGSLDSQDQRHSRSSVTCHVIAQKDRFLQLQLRLHDLETDLVNGVAVYRPKDLAKLRNRAVLWAEACFPGPFYWFKRLAIRRLAANRS